MQVKSLQNILNKIDKILSHYPDKTINYVLSDINSLLEDKSNVDTISKEERKVEVKSENEDIIQSIFSKIDTISMDEIKSLLEDKKIFPNIASIRHLAKLLGLSISQNQSRIDSTHTVIKFIERSQIDRTISSRNKSNK